MSRIQLAGIQLKMLSWALRLAYLNVVSVVGVIIRLPCLYHGDFDTQVGKYFKGVVHKTFYDLDLEGCTLKCITTKECVFVNLKMDNSECELMSSHTGVLQENLEWQFATTNYSDPKQKAGPSCDSSPCRFQEANCTTVCESPGYKCLEPYESIATPAMGAVASASSSHSDSKFQLQYAIDEYMHTESHTADSDPSPWFKITWLQVAKIYLVEVLAVGANRINTFKVKLLSHNKWILCGKLTALKWQVVYCEMKEATAVKISDRPTPEPIHIKDIIVWGNPVIPEEIPVG